MPETPSYLGLLNGIASFESRAERYFSAWADATSNDELRAVLRTVAAREGEHGMAFAKRINELGFLHTPVDDPGFDNQMAVASSDLSDIDKAEQLGVTKYLGGGLTYFDTVFADHSIDIRTGELLGRYIAEEHDTIRLLTCCYDELQCQAEAGAPAVAAQADLSGLEQKVDALCRTVDELRQIVCAQAMPVNASRGKGRPVPARG
jgi:rubrerythrin